MGWRKRAEETNGRHQHQPRKNASGKENAGDARADDVADSEIFGRDIGAERRSGQPLGVVHRRIPPGADRIHQHGVQAAEPQSPKNAAGERASAITRHKHVSASRAFRVEQIAVLFDDELAAQRNHEEHAQPSADQRQKKYAPVFQRKPQKNQRRQGENDAAGDRFTGGAGRLHDIVFKDGDFAEGAQDADRKHRDGNGCRYCKSCAQPHIDGDCAEKKAGNNAGQDGAQGEFGNTCFRIDVGLKFFRRCRRAPRFRRQASPRGPQTRFATHRAAAAAHYHPKRVCGVGHWAAVCPGATGNARGMGVILSVAKNLSVGKPP